MADLRRGRHASRGAVITRRGEDGPRVLMAVPRAVVVSPRGGRAGDQHEGGGHQASDEKVHGETLRVRDVLMLLGSRWTGSEARVQRGDVWLVPPSSQPVLRA